MKHMTRKYTKRRRNAFDACRSFFIYKDGRLFVQFVHKRTIPQPLYTQVVIDMSGGIIIGTLVEVKGTGIILSGWQIISKEHDSHSPYVMRENELNSSKYYDFEGDYK